MNAHCSVLILNENYMLDFHGQCPSANLRPIYISKETELAFSACDWIIFFPLSFLLDITAQF